MVRLWLCPMLTLVPNVAYHVHIICSLADLQRGWGDGGGVITSQQGCQTASCRLRWRSPAVRATIFHWKLDHLQVFLWRPKQVGHSKPHRMFSYSQPCGCCKGCRFDFDIGGDKENKNTVNLRSASFIVIMLLREGLTRVHSLKKPRLHFG